MAKKNRKRAPTSTTVGDLVMHLSDLYVAISQAEDDASENDAPLLAAAKKQVRWLQDTIAKQGLHNAAIKLKKLSERLKDPTNQLVNVKKALVALQNGADISTSILNAIASILPFL